MLGIFRPSTPEPLGLGDVLEWFDTLRASECALQLEEHEDAAHIMEIIRRHNVGYTQLKREKILASLRRIAKTLDRDLERCKAIAWDNAQSAIAWENAEYGSSSEDSNW